MSFRLRIDDEAVQKQMELGNLTTKDLTRMTHMTIGPTWYPLAGGLALASTAFSFTKFKPGTRTIAKIFVRASMVGTSGIVGIYAGHHLAGKIMKRKYESLENPEGFKTAVAAIKNAQLAKEGRVLVAISWTYAIVVAGQPKAVAEGQDTADDPASQPDRDEQGFQTFQTTQTDVPTSNSLPSPSSNAPEVPRRPLEEQSTRQTPSPSPASNPGSGSWEAIRGRNQSAQPTSWDLIRQRGERERVPWNSKPTTADDAYQAEAAPRSSDDAQSAFKEQADAGLTEQEKFDALLEAERRMGSRSSDAYAGWGGDDRHSRNQK